MQATRQGCSRTCRQAGRQVPCLAGRQERQVGRVLRWNMQEEAGRYEGRKAGRDAGAGRTTSSSLKVIVL